MGFPGGSVSGRESTCHAGDAVGSLGWEEPLEKEMATHSSILAWEIPRTESLEGSSSWGHKELDMTEHTRKARLYVKACLGTSWTLEPSVSCVGQREREVGLSSGLA